MRFTWYGHSCFLLETEGQRLLFDPFISPNPLASAVDIDGITPDFVLLTHGHADHVADAETILRGSGAMLISNYEIVTWYQEKGIENVWPLNIGGTARFDFGHLRFVNAVHSSVLPDGTHGGNPGGFIIETSGRRIYIAGDTALHTDMQLIGKYWSPDVAVLPIGDNFTMGAEDAIRCAEMINCKKIVGVHFDTFPYIKIDKDETKKLFHSAGLELVLFEIGESKNI